MLTLLHLYLLLKLLLSYVNGMLSYGNLWASVHRKGVLLRGHNTNNFCESKLFIWLANLFFPTI